MTTATDGVRGVGIVGCGRMGGRHAAAIGRSDRFRVVAVTDLDPAAAAQLGAATGAEVSPDLDALLGRDDVDVVAICTPTIEHAAEVMCGLDAGKDVFAEKPLATSAVDVARLVAVAGRTGRHLQTGYLYRYAPAFVRMQALLAAGAIGEPHLAILRIGGRGGHRAWKHAAASGGGAIFDMMSHMVDLAVWLLGPSDGVRLLSRSVLLPERDIEGRRRPVDAEDYCVAEWTAASGARCLVEADLVSPSFMQYVEVHGPRGSLFGSLADHLPSLVHLSEPAAGLPAGTHRFEEPRIELLDAQWASFADELDRPADGEPLEAALATAAILDALQLDRPNPPARSA